MLREIIERIFKTQLALKIWSYTFTLTLAVLFFIGIAFTSYFNVYIMTTSIDSAKSDTAYVADSFSDAYTDIMKQFVHISVASEFKSALKLVLNSTRKNYTQINNSMQDIFNEYSANNHLIKSAMIVRKSSAPSKTMFFYSYYSLMEKNIKEWDLGFSLSDITGITILPYSDRPFTNQNDAVPIVIPLNYSVADNKILIPEQTEDANFILYLFLDTEALDSFFKLYCNDNVQGTLFLVNSAGQNLSLTQNMPGHTLADSSDTAKLISAAIHQNKKYLVSGSNHFFITQIKDLDLYLVNIIPREMFTSKSDEFHIGLYWIALFSTFIITCLCLTISRLVTIPLKKLMSSVHDIEANRYTGMADIRTKDEIGQLNHSIDSLYNTIQQQFHEIKREEKEKYDAKIQVLAEQINPHFIYNTLEFINMEILNEHTENASDMIYSLGNYLRLSLAYANGMLTISQELDQIMVYVKIMNYRFNNSIHVMTQIAPELLDRKIIKSILQPLVENSIKHGFSLIMNYQAIILPVINISFKIEDSWMVLTITDNGAGFHENEISMIMLEGSSDKDKRSHIGLNNVYQRLIAFYKEVDVTFSSIPFVENKICIKIPAFYFTD